LRGLRARDRVGHHINADHPALRSDLVTRNEHVVASPEAEIDTASPGIADRVQADVRRRSTSQTPGGSSLSHDCPIALPHQRPHFVIGPTLS